jgi:hypothetical protein
VTGLPTRLRQPAQDQARCDMATPTHATVAMFRMDPAMEAAQRQGLHDFIVPSVRQAPGFVAGYWTLDRDGNESVVFILFDSRDAAASLAENVRANAPNQTAVGIELLSIRVTEISASA